MRRRRCSSIGSTKWLLRGWAYGEGGDALRGKRCLWARRTGGEPAAYGPDGMHRSAISDYVSARRAEGALLSMSWEAPLIVHGSHRGTDPELREFGRDYRLRLERLLGDARSAS